MPEDKNVIIKYVPIGLSVIAIVASGIFGSFTCRQHHLSQQLAHQHITPSLKVLFHAPKDQNPILVIQNDGDIPVTSLSVRNEVLVYDRGFNVMTSFVDARELLSDKVAFKDTLKPMEHFTQKLVKVGPTTEVVAVYRFAVRYFRGTDMKEFQQNEMFFVDDGQVHSHKQYSENPLYPVLMKALVMLKEPGLTVGQGRADESMKVIEAETK